MKGVMETFQVIKRVIKAFLRKGFTGGQNRLYAWQPKGHGELSLFVMASSEKAALECVESKIAELISSDGDGFSAGDFKGFGTDYYELSAAGLGEVLLNYND